MTLNCICNRLIACLFLSVFPGTAFVMAAQTVKTPLKVKQNETAPASDNRQEIDASMAKAGRTLAAYKANANPVEWDAFWKDFKQLVVEISKRPADLSQTLKSMSGLNDIGLRIADAPPIKVISFTRVSESSQILVGLRETITVKSSPKRGHKPAASQVVLGPLRWQGLACPGSVLVNDARLIVAGSTEAGGAVRPGHAKYLVLCGCDKKTGLAWLSAYRLAEGNWVQSPELFSGVPPYLLQNVQGKPSFSGSNLVFISEPLKSSEPADASGYKLVLRFFGDHYALDAKSSLDAAMTIAMQFSQAIQKGRMDLVKAWLPDAKLASIPGYLGLYNRPSNAPAFKLIAMTAPLNGGSRFRLITYDKNDLILDIGKIKAQWAVKGIFIAPADPVAKKLMGLSPPDNKVLDGNQEQINSKGEGGGN